MTTPRDRRMETEEWDEAQVEHVPLAAYPQSRGKDYVVEDGLKSTIDKLNDLSPNIMTFERRDLNESHQQVSLFSAQGAEQPARRSVMAMELLQS